MFLDTIEGSPSLEMVNLVLQKQAAGEKVVSLAIGEPSFNTPPAIIEAAYESMKAGDVHYTSSYGTREVRDAIVEKVNRKNHIRAKVPNTIFVTTKLSVYASLMAMIRRPCEILIPDPGYFYHEPVILAGGIPRYYRLGPDFSLDPDLLKKGITTKTRAVILNSPSNPTSRVFGRRELEEVYQTCRDRGVSIISDEAYEDLVYGRSHFSVGSMEKTPETVVTLFSLSKSYAMTGWRAGYVVADEKVVSMISRLLEHTFTSYPPFIQKASAFAIRNGDRFTEEFVRELRERKNAAEEALAKIPSLEAYKAQGAFYLFPKYKGRARSTEVAKKILLKEGVALLPGVAFGPHGEGRLRISFSGPPDILRDGMSKLRHFFAGAY